MPVKLYQEDRAEWFDEFSQITEEANALVKTYYELDEDWHVMDRINDRSAPATCAIKLTCLFVERKLHKYQSGRKKVFLAEWFKIDRTTALHHIKSGTKLVEGDQLPVSEPTIGFMELWPLMEDIGIKLNVEGWLKRRDLQIRFINRQIDMLEMRKKEIQEKQILETHV